MQKTQSYPHLGSRLFLFFTAVTILTHIVLPCWLLPQSRGWALLLLPAALSTTANWALIHEGIHRVLHPDRRTNELLSRLLCIGFGSPLRILRFGHLMHHRFNRTSLDRSETYDPATQPPWRAWPLYYLRLLGGLYLAELAAGLLVLLPRGLLLRVADRLFPSDSPLHRSLREWIERDLLRPKALGELRRDGLAALSLLAASLWLYGTHWYWLVSLLLVRGALVSLVDNSFHYGTPLGETRYSYNLRLPPWAGLLVLNFNYHRVHHRYPGLPWYLLPGRHAQLKDGFEYGFLRGVLRQLRGPIAESALPGA